MCSLTPRLRCLLQESARILVDLAAANGRPDHSFTDLKEIMETWRLRTPNDWESLVHWQDVLVWRNQIYNIVINSFGSMRDMAPALHQLGYKVGRECVLSVCGGASEPCAAARATHTHPLWPAVCQAPAQRQASLLSAFFCAVRLPAARCVSPLSYKTPC